MVARHSRARLRLPRLSARASSAHPPRHGRIRVGERGDHGEMVRAGHGFEAGRDAARPPRAPRCCGSGAGTRRSRRRPPPRRGPGLRAAARARGLRRSASALGQAERAVDGGRDEGLQIEEARDGVGPADQARQAGRAAAQSVARRQAARWPPAEWPATHERAAVAQGPAGLAHLRRRCRRPAPAGRGRSSGSRPSRPCALRPRARWLKNERSSACQ